MKFAEVVQIINAAPSGSFCGIKDYIGSNGDCSSIIGNLGFSYETAKAKAIAALEKALAEKDFQPIAVSGNCYFDGREFNSRLRSAPVKPFAIFYTVDDVIKEATDILENWKNPVERKNNKIALSEKKNGLAYNVETGKFTFSLLVTTQTYKEEKSEAVKEAMGTADKIEIKAPETLLKEKIRSRFEGKFRTFELAQGKFDEVSIGGVRFKSSEILF